MVLLLATQTDSIEYKHMVGKAIPPLWPGGPRPGKGRVHAQPRAMA